MNKFEFPVVAITPALSITIVRYVLCRLEKYMINKEFLFWLRLIKRLMIPRTRNKKVLFWIIFSCCHRLNEMIYDLMLGPKLSWLGKCISLMYFVVVVNYREWLFLSQFRIAVTLAGTLSLSSWVRLAQRREASK